MEISNKGGHSFKMRETKFQGDVRGKLFTQRVVSAWNAHLGVLAKADTIVTFKGLVPLGRHLRLIYVSYVK